MVKNLPRFVHSFLPLIFYAFDANVFSYMLLTCKSTCLVASDGIKSSRMQQDRAPQKSGQGHLRYSLDSRLAGLFFDSLLRTAIVETDARKQRLIVNSAQPDYLDLNKVQGCFKKLRYLFILDPRCLYRQTDLLLIDNFFWLI